MAAKYERVSTDLRRAITTGELKPGDPLPPQVALAERYRVSLPTVQQALGVLEGEGLIDQVQGVGTRVREPPRRQVRRKPDRYQWEKDQARASLDDRSQTGAVEHDTGLEVGDLEFHAEYDEIPANDDLARVFSVDPGTKLLRRRYSTRVKSEDIALSLIDSYLVREVVAVNPALLDVSNEPWPGGTQHQLSTVGIELAASPTRSGRGRRGTGRPKRSASARGWPSSSCAKRQPIPAAVSWKCPTWSCRATGQSWSTARSWRGGDHDACHHDRHACVPPGP